MFAYAPNILFFRGCVNKNKICFDLYIFCLLYTSDAADDMQCVDLGGRRIIKKRTCTDDQWDSCRRVAEGSGGAQRGFFKQKTAYEM